ncbi:MAG: DUF202 domain-containing protein [Spirochaetes bacterium]|nr:DUF202 domain-containing protein [Spirochaetota bacterium]
MSYARYKKEEIILRDDLAIDRTILAIERTLLSYLRFSVALLIAGITIMNVSKSAAFSIFGGICIFLGIASGITGTIRFYLMHKKISVIKHK